MAKLGRDDLKQAPDTEESRKELAELVKRTPPLSSPPNSLPLSDINVARQVFQWRSSSYGASQKQEHTLDLARALKDGRRFPPLTVYLIDKRFYVLDGHHRLDAYHTVGWTKPVPVEVFKGTFEGAWTYALKANSATKLPMSRDEKSEAAWKLTKTTELTAERLNALTGISQRTVFSMRKVWKTLCEHIKTEKGRAAFGGNIADIEGMRTGLSWPKARMIAGGAKLNDGDDWRDQKAKELAKELEKYVGKFLKYPDITADAIRRLNPDLPRALIEEWAWQERDLIQDLANQEELEF
jgi:hypothetical protein